ncbi:hypothetical protein [Cohnella zeiphila]|uniref:Fido domain-containing protein n=1 Tax=Cohnella zeiphila TaxID=2761120 RepID=A0A7X0SQP6_9BACL|nr:hypothetical protein [Cohnella zeiphila]MBB6734387.1 hypothetical protein [Cohnella zeiphila]
MHEHTKRPVESNHAPTPVNRSRVPTSSGHSSFITGDNIQRLQQRVGNQATMQLMRSTQNNNIIQRMKFDRNGNEVDPFWGAGEESDIVADTSDLNAFEIWIKKQRPEVLQKVYETLKSSSNVSREDAIAKSQLKMLMVSLDEGEKPENGLAHLPKEDWWKLFIDRDLHNANDSDKTNALRFDMDSSPGFYDAMMIGLENFVAPASSEYPTSLTSKEYMDMHQAVTKGTLIKSHEQEGKYIPIPNDKSGSTSGRGGTSFGMTKVEDSLPNIKAFKSLAEDGIVGLNPHHNRPLREAEDGDSSHTRFLREASKISSQTSTTPRTELTAFDKNTLSTKYDKSQMEDLLTKTLNRYDEEIKGIKENDKLEQGEVEEQKLYAIAGVIRELHVSHFFTDANGRLNTFLLLNRFLIEEGFSPVIMDDTSMFGGGFSIGQLVGQLKRGMNNFNDASGRERTQNVQRRNYNNFEYREEEQSSGDVLHVILFYPSSYLRKDLKEEAPEKIEEEHLKGGIREMITRFREHGKLEKGDPWRFEFKKSLHALHVENELLLYDND